MPVGGPPYRRDRAGGRYLAARTTPLGRRHPLWQKARGLRVENDVPGRLEELVVTSVGDLLGRVRFAPLLGDQRTAENMLLPPSTWQPIADDDVQRLHALVVEFGFEPGHLL